MGPDPPISFLAGLEGLRGIPHDIGTVRAVRISMARTTPEARPLCPSGLVGADRFVRRRASLVPPRPTEPCVSRVGDCGISGTCGTGSAPDGAVLGCSREYVNDMVQGLVTGSREIEDFDSHIEVRLVSAVHSMMRRSRHEYCGAYWSIDQRSGVAVRAQRSAGSEFYTSRGPTIYSLEEENRY